MFRRAEMDTRENAGRSNPHPTGASVEAGSGDGKAPIDAFELKPGEGYWLVEGRHKESSLVWWVNFHPSCGPGWEWTTCAGATRFRTKEAAEAAIRLLGAAVPPQLPRSRHRLMALYDFSATEHVDVPPAAAEPAEVVGERDGRSGIARIAGERAKQLTRWSANHDDGHTAGELVEAARDLLRTVEDPCLDKGLWNLARKHPDPIEQLTIAGALIAAEIDRLLRAQRRRDLADRFPLSAEALRDVLAWLGAELAQAKDGAQKRDLALVIGRLSEELQRVTGERDPADTSEADAAAASNGDRPVVCEGCGEKPAVRCTADDVLLCGGCYDEVPRSDPETARQARGDRVHILKCWPKYFDAILAGDKRCELRRDDRGGFEPDDVLRLQEFVPAHHANAADDTLRGDWDAEGYTGAELFAIVTDVVTHDPAYPEIGVPEGFALLSIKLIRSSRRWFTQEEVSHG